MKMKVFSFCQRSIARSSLPGLIIYFLIFDLLDSAPFTVIGPSHPITAIVGEDAVLPCHLSPRMSAENLEVRWFRFQFSSLVYLYRDGKDQNDYQLQEYRGRTELLRNNITSGNVALRIRDIRLSDEGQYSCLFQSTTFYAKAQLELMVAGLGSDPLISVEDYQDGGIRVACRSAGWHPEPEVLWRDSTGKHLTAFSATTKLQVDSNLFETDVSIIIKEQPSQNFSCHVRNIILGQEKKSSIDIAGPIFPRLNLFMVALIILILLFAVICLAVYLLKRKGALVIEFRQNQPEKPMDKVNVTLDPNTAHPRLRLSNDQKIVTETDTQEDLPDNPERFDYELCVLGCEGLNSGRHYWEVELWAGGYWAVGVARQSVRRKGVIIFSPDEGIWSVASWLNQYWARTSPETVLALKGPPRRIRVCLDYEGEQVAFYNADTGASIFTFQPALFCNERIYPWFWVGMKSHIRQCP